ncbi:MAG: bifunctional 2-C-methyl-D-erythritol 4-phosphate cytidylyltransferase/2-C-methyl-D-erythritol 2,4-cyclodiphosphate synthase [Marinosulfonomonas sp.]|nr:bifunctional 2-C-methyl-D-erythritol 4-phosphate cytidylyltransferase/2-C-methyl-D-erythritol 2,4-cyclodiphosphate synthase [Marinosulfonomonas sp.]
MTTSAVIVAAGRGTRAGGSVAKQWRMLAGRPVAAHVLEQFLAAPDIGPIVLVVHPDDIAMATDLIAGRDVKLTKGGASRDASVRAGLEALKASAPSHVLIHDVARPLVSQALIARVCEALKTNSAAAPALPVTDTLWRGEAGLVAGIVSRDGLFGAQTPQGFEFDAILAAHRSHEGRATDDVGVAQAAGIPVTIVDGEARNLKITTEDDFKRAEQLIGTAMDIRTGNGFDVHRFSDGDAVTLCGVRVPFTHGLDGHSDADVGMHALTDAIYGALAYGDIGQHFPPSDPQWKGVASYVFLEHAAGAARERGYGLSNCDVTLICEAPKIGPHARAMSQRLAEILQVDADRVSVKATTSERLGFTGRGEGIAAMATATLVKS